MRRKSRQSRMFLADHFFQADRCVFAEQMCLLRCALAGSVACPARIIFFKRIDVFLQSRYACCGVRLRVRWLAPPGAHNDLRWFRWHAPPSSKDSEGALLKPPFSGSVLRKAFVCEGGSKNKTFVRSLPASCGRAHCYYQTFSGAWPHAKSGLVTLKFS